MTFLDNPDHNCAIWCSVRTLYNNYITDSGDNAYTNLKGHV